MFDKKKIKWCKLHSPNIRIDNESHGRNKLRAKDDFSALIFVPSS